MLCLVGLRFVACREEKEDEELRLVSYFQSSVKLFANSQRCL